MKKELLNKLLEYIDARIAEKLAIRESSDGALYEGIRVRDLEQELRDIAEEPAP